MCAIALFALCGWLSISLLANISFCVVFLHWLQRAVAKGCGEGEAEGFGLAIDFNQCSTTSLCDEENMVKQPPVRPPSEAMVGERLVYAK